MFLYIVGAIRFFGGYYDPHLNSSAPIPQLLEEEIKKIWECFRVVQVIVKISSLRLQSLMNNALLIIF